MLDNLGKELGLTPIELEVLHHRLSASDAIVESMMDTYTPEGEPLYAQADIENIIDHLQNGDLTEARRCSDVITADVLRDCVAGNTIAALAAEAHDNAEITHLRFDKIIDAGRSLAKKIQAIDPQDREPASFPAC